MIVPAVLASTLLVVVHGQGTASAEPNSVLLDRRCELGVLGFGDFMIPITTNDSPDTVQAGGQVSIDITTGLPQTELEAMVLGVRTTFPIPDGLTLASLTFGAGAGATPNFTGTHTAAGGLLNLAYASTAPGGVVLQESVLPVATATFTVSPALAGTTISWLPPSVVAADLDVGTPLTTSCVAKGAEPVLNTTPVAGTGTTTTTASSTTTTTTTTTTSPSTTTTTRPATPGADFLRFLRALVCRVFPSFCAPTGLDERFGTGGVVIRGLSPDANDRFLTVANGPRGTFYAGGYTTLAGGDQAFAVAKIDREGNLVPGFGTGGLAVANVSVGGKTAEVGRTVAVQSDGKIVIGGPAEHDPTATGDAARDNDAAVARFNTDGTLDTSFGTGGIARLDFGAGRLASPTGTAYLADQAWGLGTTARNGVVVWGTTPSASGTDNDYVLAKLTDSGGPDRAFGTDGITKLDLGSSPDNARNLLVQPDGRIVAAGYSVVPATGLLQPVLFRVTADGKPDATFGTAGVATAPVLPGQSEAYGIKQHKDGYVLTGYGRGADVGEPVDAIVYRFSKSGVWDTTFGTGGVTRIDTAGQADRARNVLVLPDDRILVPGSAASSATEVDGLVALLSPKGVPDTDFNRTGTVVSHLGGPADSWYGATLASDKRTVVVVGYKGVTTASGGNDDAAVARIDLRK